MLLNWGMMSPLTSFASLLKLEILYCPECFDLMIVVVNFQSCFEPMPPPLPDTHTRRPLPSVSPAAAMTLASLASAPALEARMIP